MKRENNVVVRIDGRSQALNKHHGRDRTAASQDEKEKWIWTFDDKSPSDDNGRTESKGNIVDILKKRQAKDEAGKPFWDDGKSETSPKLPPHNRKKNKPSFDRFSFGFLRNPVFLSIMAAVLLGGSFGMMMLSLMSGDGAATEGGGPGVQESTVSLSEASAATAPETELSHTLPEIRLYAVQGGAFSTVEKGEEMAAVLEEDGIPAFLNTVEETHFLFMGIASSQEEAEKAAETYENNGFGTYVKPWKIEPGNTAVDEAASTFAQAGIAWMETAAQMSSAVLSGSSLEEQHLETLISEAEMWQQAYEELQLDGSTFESAAAEWFRQSESVMETDSRGISEEDFAKELQQTILISMSRYNEVINAAETSSGESM